MKRRKGIDKAVIFLILIILVLLITSVFIYTRIKTDKITSAVKGNQLLDILFLIKKDDELKYTELFLYSSQTHKGALFDVPGNVGSIITQVDKMDRIDSIFSAQKPISYVEKIENIVGLKIPYYIIIDINDLTKIVDIFEGIKLFIPNPVEIIEPEELILLPSGNVVLDGEKAALYMQYSEKGEADVESISRRQKVLQSLFIKIGENNILLKSRKIQSVLYSMVRTNLSKTSLTALLNEVRFLDTDRMVFQRVLGTERRIGEDILLFPHYEGKLLKETVSQTVDSLANSEVLSTDALHMSIDILNGTSQNGLAGRTSQVFKSFGFDVLNLGNYASDDLEKTIVVSRSMDSTVAEKVADIIKCRNIKYSYDIDITDEDIINDSSDVIVILGKDFDGRYCKD